MTTPRVGIKQESLGAMIHSHIKENLIRFAQWEASFQKEFFICLNH